MVPDVMAAASLFLLLPCQPVLRASFEPPMALACPSVSLALGEGENGAETQ